MKKLILSIGLGFVAVSLMAQANLDSVNNSFLNNGTYLCLSNNTTYTWTTLGSSSNAWFFSYPSFTNVCWMYSTSNAPAATVDADVIADRNGDINPNMAISVVIGVYTNWPSVIPNWPTYNRQTPSALGVAGTGYSLMTGSNLPAAFFTSTVAATNSVVLTFAPVSPEGYADTSEGKQFSFTVAQSSVTLPRVITTNVPTTFLQGARKVRLVSVVIGSTGAAQGVVVDSLSLVGWRP